MHTRHTIILRNGHPGWMAVESALGTLPELRVTGAPPQLAEAEALARRTQPGLIVAADEVCGERVLPFLYTLRPHVPATRFLVVGDDFQADELLLISEAGVSSYLYWDDLLSDPTAYLRVAVAGKAVLFSVSIAAAHLAAERYQSHANLSEPSINSRELQVLRGLVEGLTHKAIAELLGVGTRTIERTIEGLCEKLDASNPYALVMKAAQRGLIP